MSRLARRPLLRAFSSSDQQLRAQLVGDRNVDIFDRDVKRKQRDRAAWLMKADDQLLSKATEGLLDRLDDCKRKFPTALNLGGAFEHVRRLLHGRGGVETLINMDISTDMIEKSRQNVAAEISVNVGSPAITNVHMVGDEEFLPLEERSLDLVVSSLGLHWVNDLPGAIIQCRNALKPDGLFLASIFGGESLSELRIACTCAQLEREGGVSPRISPLAQMRDAGNLLTRAGLALSEVDVDTFTVRYPSALELIDNLREMGETNAVRQRNQVLRRDTALAAAAIYEAMFAAEDGSVPATFQVLYLTGWSPHASQQAPKRRGSATVSFQDLQKALDEKPAEASSREPGEEQPKAQPPASKDAEEAVHLPSGTWYTLK